VEQQVEELQEQNSTEDDPTIEEDELADEEIDEEIADLLAAELSAPPHAHTCINNEHDCAQQSCPINNEDGAIVIHLPKTRKQTARRYITDIKWLLSLSSNDQFHYQLPDAQKSWTKHFIRYFDAHVLPDIDELGDYRLRGEFGMLAMDKSVLLTLDLINPNEIINNIRRLGNKFKDVPVQEDKPKPLTAFQLSEIFPTNSTKRVETKLVKKPTKVAQCRTPLANILNISDDDF
ncbi:unnamed protein product, partial [Didymodactylos carnosus]